MINIRKRKTKLWKETDGKCYWCGVKTYLSPRGEKTVATDTLATLDHLRSRFDMENRLKPNKNNEIRTVLACFKCNTLRGKLESLSRQDIKIKKPKPK